MKGYAGESIAESDLPSTKIWIVEIGIGEAYWDHFYTIGNDFQQVYDKARNWIDTVYDPKGKGPFCIRSIEQSRKAVFIPEIRLFNTLE